MNKRSDEWLGGDDEVAMLHRTARRLSPDDVGKPIIGIADTASDLNPCNAGFDNVLPDLAAGIRNAGGHPVRFPAMSLGEDLMKPAAMLYRNLVSMELEETVRSNPLDGVVFTANCDKSVPAALMAAASLPVPSILLLGGARAAPLFCGRPMASGTDLWRALHERRTGRMDDGQWRALETCLAGAGPGSCNTMGTASTMSAMAEALGMSVPAVTGIPAGSPKLRAVAFRTGQVAVHRVRDEVRPDRHLTQQALDNAIVLLAALGGSTNAVIHLAAVAGRCGLDAGLTRMDRLWREVPVLADIEPIGRLLIHDFERAGGVAAVAGALGELFDGTVLAGDGIPWHDHIARVPAATSTIRSMDDPVVAAPALAALFGSLAPQGAVIKVAAASPELLSHTGRAVVFDDYHQMRAALDDPQLECSPSDVLVVRGSGPIGVPGMPEWGMAPIPQRLADSGVTDMVRISDGRMSGTSFGTVVLHVTPEAAVDGPLARIRTGDRVRLDLQERTLDLLVDAEEFARRRPADIAGAGGHLRGWPKMYQDHVLPAPAGCDLDFLAAPTAAHRRFVPPVVGRS